MNIKKLFYRNCPGIGLEELSKFLVQLGAPQKKLAIIHVAGTNGKGSTCTLLANVLQEAGFRTGLFVSPHLQDPTERIQIDGKSISPLELNAILQEIFSIEKEPLNFFELLTVVAFIYFARNEVDYVVLETGLGGRKDPTNVCMPLCSVITSIGLDHTLYLGNTLAKIAREKAGIIKFSKPVFLGRLPAEAISVICEEATRQKAPIYRLIDEISFSSFDFTNGNIFLRTNDGELFPLHLLGEMQVDTAKLVYQIASFLGIKFNAIKSGFSKVSIPGRFERIFYKGKTIILDGAHNEQAIGNLLHFWNQSPYASDATIFCGFMKDKNYISMLNDLSQVFKQGTIFHMPNKRSADQNCFQKFFSEHPSWKFSESFENILNVTEKNILCTGSFYLVGALRNLILKNLL